MVDFSKQLKTNKVTKFIDPIELYSSLDRKADKGPLRPAQEKVLQSWFANNRSQKDVIVKLHTGQGKTLIGLLMLQSRLNEFKEPVVYLCPNNFLIEQTCSQARQFGISVCQVGADRNLPEDFLSSKMILVTSVQKLFTGVTRFGLGSKSLKVDTVLMDDAHACSDSIRAACQIRISKDENIYSELRSMFAADLEGQGVGTFADLENGSREAILPVPYWAWQDKVADVAKLLSKSNSSKSIKYAWPILKDNLKHCRCYFSGASIEIEPYLAPLNEFGSYYNAKHRIFMSATVTDDAFLIKGLRLKKETIQNPLTFQDETWSGEKMILMPEIIHEDLKRSEIIHMFGEPTPEKKSGTAVLVPSFKKTKDWETAGGIVPKSADIWDAIQALKEKNFLKPVILANRYDGIDLPDNSCRILIFDSAPFSENLSDLGEEYCRPASDATYMRIVRTIEQGMGRSVRGEKDYSVIIVLGSDLIRILRDKNSQKYLSPQMSEQIRIGIEVSKLASNEIEEGSTPKKAFRGVIKQCLKRDDGWKAFYKERMDEVEPKQQNESILEQYETELDAEVEFIKGNFPGAADILQNLIDKDVAHDDDRGWYLQEIARYTYSVDRLESQGFQISAHKKNRFLLKPSDGVTVSKLSLIPHSRAEAISKWVETFKDYNEMNVTISDILSNLAFGVKADKFEESFRQLGAALGFASERPDKEWKEGPDNLWAIEKNKYLLVECKNEVLTDRTEINKRESEQMNRSSAWFTKQYIGCSAKRVIIHPARKIGSAGSFLDDVEVMAAPDLKKFVRNCTSFFKAFKLKDLASLSSTDIQKELVSHNLSNEEVLNLYSRKIRDLKNNLVHGH